MKHSSFDAIIPALDAKTSAIDAETSALGALTSGIARSYWRYQCGVFGICGVGVTPQMCNRVTNHKDMGTLSRPGDWSAVAIQLAKAIGLFSTVIQRRNNFFYYVRELESEMLATHRPTDHDGNECLKILKEIGIRHWRLWDWDDEMRMVLPYW